MKKIKYFEFNRKLTNKKINHQINFLIERMQKDKNKIISVQTTMNEETVLFTILYKEKDNGLRKIF